MGRKCLCTFSGSRIHKKCCLLESDLQIGLFAIKIQIPTTLNERKGKLDLLMSQSLHSIYLQLPNVSDVKISKLLSMSISKMTNLKVLTVVGKVFSLPVPLLVLFCGSN